MSSAAPVSAGLPGRLTAAVSAARGEASSVRSRALFVVIAVTALSVLLIGAGTHVSRWQDIRGTVLEATAQEAEELQLLLERGPAAVPDRSGRSLEQAQQDQAFRDVEHLLYTFMSTSVPAEAEQIVAVVDGRLTYSYDGPAGAGLDRSALVRAAERGQPGATVHFTEKVGESTVGFGVISVSVPGDQRMGYLVVATDVSGMRQDVIDSWWRYVTVSLVVLTLSSLLAYVLIGRVTAPIARLRRATEQISPTDLSQRVEVPAEDSDVARLASNVNTMLDRIEGGFLEQRQFLDDAAHELRTPLTILSGNLELMDESDPADVGETRELMLDEIERMNRLVEDLLLLAKARRPDFIRPQAMELAPFLEDAVARMRALKDRTVVVDAAATGTICADRERLMQAVVQLVANAMKFSSAGDTIALGAMWVEQVDDDGAPTRQLDLWVRDTGEGIAPEDQRRIFERFGRAAHGRSVEGSGLGLSIVSAIAVGHGGSVGLRSSPGSGAWFTLHLPAGGPEADPATGPELAPDRP